MVLQIRCPACKETFKIKEKLAGQMVKCPRCKYATIAPLGAVEPAGAPRSGRRKRRSRRGLLLKLGLAFLVLLVVAGVALYFTANALASKAIAAGGSYALGTEVTVDGVSLSPKGSASISGLRVKNPEGFTQPEALSLGKIAVQLELSSLLSDTVRVNEIVIEDAAVTLERVGLKTNLGVLIGNAKKKFASSGEPVAEKGKEPPPPAASGKLFVGRLRIAGAKVTYHDPSLEKPKSVELPVIEVAEIGETTMGALTARIFKLLAARAVQSDILDRVGLGRDFRRSLTSGDLGEARKAIESVKGKFRGILDR